MNGCKRVWSIKMSELTAPHEIKRSYAGGVFRAVNSLSDGILCVGPDNKVSYLNPAAEVLTGWSLQEALGRPYCEVFRVVNSVTRQAAWQPIQAAMQDNSPY